MRDFASVLTKKNGLSGTSASSSGVAGDCAKSPEELQKHSKIVYDWLKRPTSRIRMLINFQGAGGLPFVAQAHHRVAQGFVYHGNSTHGGTEVSLQQFQEAVLARHKLGDSGISEACEDSNDFKL